MNIRLVPKQTWAGITRSRFQMLTPDARRAAYSILRTMHNRHVGITPDLAAQLAPLILEPTAAFQVEGPWAHVMERLTRELSAGRYREKFSRQMGFGVLFSAIPPYSVIRLAMPIVEEACRRTGLCCLFCEDETGNVLTEAYRRYSGAVSDEIEKMTEEIDGFFQVFWTERALTLAAYSRRPGLWSIEKENTAVVGLPETDPAAAGLMLRLKPRIQPPKPLSRRQEAMTSPLKHRESPKNKEGGFSGIKITLQQEEMENILMSEFLNPPLLLADRLVNSGYLALKRKPKHERLRDVLIAGIMPNEIKPKLNVDFVKACWFDFITRFGFMLARQRLMRSEFRWLEGDMFGRSRDCRFRLEDLPLHKPPDETEPSAAYRRSFLVALGWFPSYLDTLNGFDVVPVVTGSPGGAGETDLAMRWAFSAWKGQNLRHARRAAVDEFAFVHIMLFLPAQEGMEIGAPPQALLRQMQRGFGIGNAPGRTTSITRVPETLEDLKQWTVDHRRKRESLFFSKSSPGMTWEDIAGNLEHVWLQHTIEEMRNA
jgi:hypothetical protein